MKCFGLNLREEEREREGNRMHNIRSMDDSFLVKNSCDMIEMTWKEWENVLHFIITHDLDVILCVDWVGRPRWFVGWLPRAHSKQCTKFHINVHLFFYALQTIILYIDTSSHQTHSNPTQLNIFVCFIFAIV